MLAPSKLFFERTQKNSIYNIQPISNILSVVSHGILSYNRAAKMAHKSIAMSDVQSRRDNVVIPNGGHLHSYANAYFNPRNPMMYKRKDMAEILCVLAISALVLDCAGTIISDGNAASAYSRFYSPKGGVKVKILLGNIFDSKCSTLVNTVNCVGVMGKGIALDFKKKYPGMFDEYQTLCKEGRVKPGQPYLYRDLAGNSIINFPTKDNWRSPSKFSYITKGLKWFQQSYQELGITSVAFPPLGCGNGGLKWDDVGPEMYRALKDLPIEIEIYAPYGTPKEKLTFQYLEQAGTASETLKGVKRASFNDKWLLILEVVRQVNAQRYSLHVGRVIFQKICYVLTRSGIQTGFTFIKASYGPYSAEVKESITTLSNANLMVESQHVGQNMVETRVTPNFAFDPSLYTSDELQCLNKTVDLFCRIKNTDQAEMMATVMFSYDRLKLRNAEVTEEDVLRDVLDWKKRWVGVKEDEIRHTIRDLSILGWLQPKISFPVEEEY